MCMETWRRQSGTRIERFKGLTRLWERPFKTVHAGECHRKNLRAVTCRDAGGEHDFGSIEFNGERIFRTIDYCDAACKWGSEDPRERCAF